MLHNTSGDFIPILDHLKIEILKNFSLEKHLLLNLSLWGIWIAFLENWEKTPTLHLQYNQKYDQIWPGFDKQFVSDKESFHGIV